MNPIKLIGIGILSLFVIIGGFRSYSPVDRGFVGVVTTFGEVNTEELKAGLHWIKPWANLEQINVQNSAETFEGVDVPSQDKLLTDVDVTVKWHVDPSMAAESLRDTGHKEALVKTHLVPKARSTIRETGKTIAKADDFFKDEVQEQMQSAIFNDLTKVLSPKGIVIDAVLIRGIRLPRSVAEGVIATKQREIEGQKQIAELERFKTEQQQKVAFATAEAQAAEQEKVKRSTLADAQAYEITAKAIAEAESIRLQGEALAENPDLIKLRQIEQWDGVMPKFISSGSEGGGMSMLFSMSDVAK